MIARLLPYAAEFISIHNITMKHLNTHHDDVPARFNKEARIEAPRSPIGQLNKGEDISVKYNGSSAINTALYEAANRVERYEIVSYGCLHEWAELLDKEEAARLVQGILDEEKAASESLNNRAHATSNNQARRTSAEARKSNIKIAATTAICR